MVRVFTAAALNYLGKARTLFHSIRQQHPEFSLHLALADRPTPLVATDDEPFDELITIDDLERCKDPSWLFAHSIVELCTAIKGEVSLKLMNMPDTDHVLFFDPDIVLFSRIDDILEELGRGSLVLTPHLLKPETDVEAIWDNEICSLQHGVFNLGFLGVSNVDEGRQFLSWYSQRLLQFCRDDRTRGLFTDQKWVDLSLAFFEGVKILRSPRFNVAPWNVNQRTVSGTFDVGFHVDGEPLGFYHFTGFDSGAHEDMLRKYAEDNAALRMMVEWYARRSSWLSLDPNPAWSLGFFDDGTPIEPVHRHLYRTRQDLMLAFTDPYRTRGLDLSYLSWFRNRAHLEHPELSSDRGPLTRP